MKLQHLERIDQLQIISKEIWKCYHDESQPLKKVQMLWYLVATQPYLSQYYEATCNVIKLSGDKNLPRNDSGRLPYELP